MSIKNRLLAAGMAVTALVGGQSEARPAEDSVSDKVVVAQNDAYWKHCEKIRSNISGRIFSFGDEKLMQKAFMTLAKIEKNRKLIMALPDDYKIVSETFSDEYVGAKGKNVVLQNKTVFNTNSISSDSPDIQIRHALYGKQKDEVPYQIIEIMKHELVHEWDAKSDRMLLNMGARGFEAFQAIIQTEAHANSLTWVDSLTYRFIDVYDFGTARNLNRFKTSNLNSLITEVEKAEKSQLTNEDKIVLKLLQGKIKSGKSLDRAQREVVGVLMNDFLNCKGEYYGYSFLCRYQYQAACSMLSQYKSGMITLKGQPDKAKETSQFYAKEYKQPYHNMDGCASTSELIEIVILAETVLHLYPDTKSRQYHEGLRDTKMKLDNAWEKMKLKMEERIKEKPDATANVSKTLKTSVDLNQKNKMTIDFANRNRQGMA